MGVLYDSDRNNEIYGEGLIHRQDKAWMNYFEANLPKKDISILDVGCGTGFLSLPLAKVGYGVTGVDLSEGMMDQCRKKMVASSLSFTLTKGDVEDLPFEDETFDVIVSRWVLWTLLHPEKAVSEWMRVLKPGGRIFIIDTPENIRSGTGILTGIRKQIARLMISILEQRNMWREQYGFGIRDHLPLSYDKPGFYDRQLGIIRDANFQGVISERMDEPSDVQKEFYLKQPYWYRFGFGYTGDWYCITGKKPAHFPQ